MNFLIRTSGMQIDLNVNEDSTDLLSDVITLVMRKLHNIPETTQTVLQFKPTAFSSDEPVFKPGAIKPFELHLIEPNDEMPACVRPDFVVNSKLSYSLFIVCTE